MPFPLFAPSNTKHRWLAARPEIRAGVDLHDNGYQLSVVRIATDCHRLEAPHSSVQLIHQVNESLPSLAASPTQYLALLSSRMPRFATRGGMPTSLSLPPTLQSLRCIANDMLLVAEPSLADDLGGPVQCKAWPAGATKSMICAARADIAAAIVKQIEPIGFRCESILPRAVSLARTVSLVNKTDNAVIAYWQRDQILVAVVADRSIRFCRELLIDDHVHSDDESGDDVLANRCTELVGEIASTLQHAARINPQTVPAPIVLCGPMSCLAGVHEMVNQCLLATLGCEAQCWNDAAAVSTSLAVGGSRWAIRRWSSGATAR